MEVVDRVKNWSKFFDLPVKESFSLPSEDRLELCMKLIREEYEELCDASNNEELCDALGDLLWVTIRMMLECGIEPSKCIESIYKSNMSKIDYSKEDSIETYNKYKSDGVATYSREIDGKFITYRASDNKVMKSCKFREPDFSDILK